MNNEYSEETNDDLERVALRDTEPGQFWTLGPDSPVTFQTVKHTVGHTRRPMTIANVHGGNSDGTAYNRVLHKTEMTVVLLDCEQAGQRIGKAVAALSQFSPLGARHLDIGPVE